MVIKKAFQGDDSIGFGYMETKQLQKENNIVP